MNKINKSIFFFFLNSDILEIDLLYCTNFTFTVLSEKKKLIKYSMYLVQMVSLIEFFRISTSFFFFCYNKELKEKDFP